MRAVQYLFLNRALEMSVGKSCAQVSHAAVESYRISNISLVRAWLLGGHYTKLVMLARDSEHIHIIQKYIEDRGYKTKLIIDEGLTELEPHQPTALGVEIVDKDDPNVLATFSTFELYREKIKVTMEIVK
jgi:peptidyl-tRNA hydrolase